MAVSSSKTNLEKYRPQLDNTESKCIWVLPSDFRENEGLATLGLLQSILLNDSVKSCHINFNNVVWADPQPLLCLGLVLAESKLSKNKIILDLGNKKSASSHRIFLKFLAQQGFLTALGSYVSFQYDWKIQKDVQALRLNLATEPQSLHFQNADCIFARMMRVDQNNHEKLQEVVEELLKEAQYRAISSAFGAEPFARDMLFQKLRRLLFELICNVAEHSHLRGEPAYVGIYARIRGPKPSTEDDAKEWTKLYHKTVQTFGQQQFSPNPYAEWLELFVCDVGIGLTANIADWKDPVDPDVASDLREAKKAKNPFMSIAHRLFRNALSRHFRHDVNRTAVTGLQYLGHLLSIGGDYCRIYTQHGCWVGGHLPWENSTHSRTEFDTLKGYEELSPVSGTAYAFSIQPAHYNLFIEQSAWVYPEEASRAAILAELHTQTTFTPSIKCNYYDRRTKNNCLPPSIEELSLQPPSVIVLRPPRLTSKHDISKWLSLVAGFPGILPTRPVNIFILADLTPFQTLSFREFLLNIYVHIETQLDIYLVSEPWAVACVSTTIGRNKFEPANEKAIEFLKSNNIDQSITAAQLAVLLRQMDSEIFWMSESDKMLDPFFNKPVDWPVTKDSKQIIRLQRYLDFSRALADPERYRACRRALRRCLALYPNHQPVGADDLVDSLVKDALLNSYTKNLDVKSPVIIVGSVAVTAGTVNRLNPEGNLESIHMMIHDDAPNRGKIESLAAMLWISQLGKNEETLPETNTTKSRPWRRIPNTSYIAPLGEKSVSILRYVREKDGNLNFAEPLYGRTPEDTYNDFQRLGVLKTGHWKYGSRHDLQTINMRLAFRFSFLELGPLYVWLKDQFKRLFSLDNENKTALAQLLIYPSHRVTDSILDRIRQDPGFVGVLPEGGMIPVKFLGMHTVSPLLASHLVAYRIQKLVTERNWADWSAVIFDDGAVSGKHMRELTQFLQSLNANVYTLALLDRTGLPAQEAVFEKFSRRHSRLWRWDIPSLGNKRDCPLCQGLAITQTYSDRLPSERQKKRLSEWSELWKVRDVDTEWHHGGLQQTHFVPPLKITFGVDEDSNGKRQEKDLFLNNSTAATSVLLELTRLTSRVDVTMKKAKIVAKTNPDAAIEMIASQLLLFLDELNFQEKCDRFIQLLHLIWTRPVVTPAMSLAGFCFSLADHDVLKEIWSFCKVELLPKKPLGNLDASIAAFILRNRYAFVTKAPYQLPENAGDIERDNFIMLGGRGSFRQSIRNFLEIYRNPATPESVNSHTTEIRKRLSALHKSNIDININEFVKDTILVLNDMRVVEQILINVQNEHVISKIDSELENLNKHINRIENAINIIDSALEDNHKLVESIIEISGTIYVLVYGDSLYCGLLKTVTDQFIRYFASSDDIDNKLFAPIVRSVRNVWVDSVRAKAMSQQNIEVARRWMGNKENEVIKPIIRSSMIQKLQQMWIYCDSFVLQTIEDAFANVYHATKEITNPWGGVGIQENLAHLWWRIGIDGNYAVFETANSSANREIAFKQNVSIAGLERAGGSIDVMVKNDLTNQFIAFTTIRIPLHSAFFKERI